MNKTQIKPVWILLAVIVLGFGLYLRFWNIVQNQFLFYDEGMYLGYNRKFLNLVSANPPKDIHEFLIILGLIFKASLSTAKSLWFFLLNLRVFTVGVDAFYFARIVSAVSGVATIFLTYLFAYRYFQSKKIAFLSALFLMLLPSHVFYSRLGMQESLSTLLFLGALYVYVFYRAKKWGVVLAAFLLSCVFLTNYRMIIGPVFMLAIEAIEMLKSRERLNWKRPLIGALIFAGIVFVIGSLYDGINRHVTFGWMFHQAQEAQGQRSLINIFSYPYYVFVLEGILFALIFWSNLYLVIQKQWSKILPFALVLLQMGIFSLAAERGARYVCVLLPMMAIAAAVVIQYFEETLKLKKVYLAAFVVLVCLAMGIQSLRIAYAQTDYAQAVSFILKADPQARILSTQAMVEQLYVDQEERVKELPHHLVDVVELYKQGYRYLILDPQVYISWTKNGQRFSPLLVDYLQTISEQVKPLAVYPHLNDGLMRRFVLDHNQNLLQSIKFLQIASAKEYGKIRIYDLASCLMFLKQQAISPVVAE